MNPDEITPGPQPKAPTWETVGADVYPMTRPRATIHSTVTAVTLCLCVTFLLALLIIRIT